MVLICVKHVILALVAADKVALLKLPNTFLTTEKHENPNDAQTLTKWFLWLLRSLNCASHKEHWLLTALCTTFTWLFTSSGV